MTLIKNLFTLLTLSLLTFACTGILPEQKEEVQPQQKLEVQAKENGDAHSYANIKEIKTQHLHLDLEVDFNDKIIFGVARHTMLNMGTDTAIFDVSGLDIQRVTIGKTNEVETDYIIGEEKGEQGAPLAVQITDTTTHINIYYKTTEASNALDWLAPSMTEGKVHPFLYTQGQAILTRTWIPLQDTPANRITYSADLTVPKDLIALMSATNPTEKNAEGKYHFEMDQAIPCYLIALAVGDIAYASLGENCGVYSEPSLIEVVKYEFADLPKMIEAAENLYGKYQWEVYDVLVLPYSFPFGGMENPRLTFANPTLIAGDRSSTSVIAHELAHSWSGNLVTNATWDDFWLNEGFTVYFENRIMESIYGKEIADMLALVEFQELKHTLAKMAASEHPEDSRLKLDLDKRRPDDGMTDIAYVKGAFFLKTLEDTVGREAFDIFLNKYFETHKFQTLTTEEFISYLNKELLTPAGIKFNTEEWIYENGLPANCKEISSNRFELAEENAKAIAEGNTKQLKSLQRDTYVMQEWLAFLRTLDGQDIDTNLMAKLDAHCEFTHWGNAEIAEEWYGLAIKTGYMPVKDELEAFLMKVGRRKFLEPLYEALIAGKHEGLNKEFALEIFEKAKDNYHAVSATTLREMLDI
ncbi:Leukotriene A4 hydrolase, C-terminal [Lishizhenia tianjinensis]|uniref:Aminopeptidase N n=1 Tax=Lishizhenia tianjinensis TaxID=477690 RepID=A0A1I7AEA3_9FLAO|nr:M1 family metallopeptidase [Lishizhenia tianjinensis]SFT73225.1 Leukotriene A4 hydrolase, C-terminal [Lishizhenia tianjinensis]